jgi:hypothetical protein
MFHAFAPRMPRGFSWVWSAIAVIAVAVSDTHSVAQAPAVPKSDEAKAKKKAEVPEPVIPDSATSSTEIFLDPNAKKALTKVEPLNFVGTAIKFGPADRDISSIQAMATGAMAVDTAFLRRYVEFFAVELSKRDNINAMISPPERLQPDAARGLERAVERLIDPMIRGKATDQRAFLAAYNKALFDSQLVKLLENNLYSRIDAMIVLGMAGSTDSRALELYIAQIKKPDQVVWVKMWAARGISNAARQGKDNLDFTKTIDAADALITLLDSDPKLPWPVQMRALEALGSLRLAVNKVRKPVDAASVAMRFLADREARPEVRAWAAWALGMMKVSPQVSPYNFELLGHKIGELAVDLGQKIVEEYDVSAANFEKRKDRSNLLTSLLIFQVFPALDGQEGVTESGLLRSTHPGLAAAKPFLTRVKDKVKDVTREAFELNRAGGVAQKSRRDDLDAKTSDLKGFLAQVNPKDRHLVPNGPEFAANAARVVGAAGR